MPPFKIFIVPFLIASQGKMPQNQNKCMDFNAGDKMRSIFAGNQCPFSWHFTIPTAKCLHSVSSLHLTLSLGVTGFFCLNIPEEINKGAHAAC